MGVQAVRLEARFGGLVDMIGAVSTALILGLGVVSVAAGRITPGDLVVFVAYSGKLYKPLRDIARQSTRVGARDGAAGADRRDPALRRGARGARRRARAEPPAGARRDPRSRACRSATPRTGGRCGTSTCTSPPGTRSRVVGASGAGKSTVGALVARFYDPTSGRGLLRRPRRARSARWSGCASRSACSSRTRSCSAGRSAENIAYGREAPAWRIAECAELAGADRVRRAAARGARHRCSVPAGPGCRAASASASAIARVLLRDPPVLVLDEPTTGLDAESERRVLDGVFSLMNGRTTLFVTHSMPLARSADLVVVMSRRADRRGRASRGAAVPVLGVRQPLVDAGEQDAGGEWSVSVPLPVGVQGVVEQVEEQGGPGRAGPVPAPDGTGRQVETDPERRPAEQEAEPRPGSGRGRRG